MSNVPKDLDLISDIEQMWEYLTDRREDRSESEAEYYATS